MTSPNFIKVNDKNELGISAADFLSETIKNTNIPTIILPTGFTPLPLYKEIVKRYNDGNTYLSMFKYLALDEYLGLDKEDNRSFASWLSKEILNPLSIPDKHRITFDSSTKDTKKECLNIDQTIKSNGEIDLAIIGIGSNGHIGFNEPGGSLNSITREVKLTPETRKANAEYWGNIDKVPTHAMTLGINTLKDAKKTLLIVSGKHKASILNKTFNAPIGKEIPSTYLQNQKNLTIIADSDALSELN